MKGRERRGGVCHDFDSRVMYAVLVSLFDNAAQSHTPLADSALPRKFQSRAWHSRPQATRNNETQAKQVWLGSNATLYNNQFEMLRNQCSKLPRVAHRVASVLPQFLGTLPRPLSHRAPVHPKSKETALPTRHGSWFFPFWACARDTNCFEHVPFSPRAAASRSHGLPCM